MFLEEIIHNRVELLIFSVYLVFGTTAYIPVFLFVKYSLVPLVTYARSLKQFSSSESVDFLGSQGNIRQLQDPIRQLVWFWISKSLVMLGEFLMRSRLGYGESQREVECLGGVSLWKAAAGLGRPE